MSFLCACVVFGQNTFDPNDVVDLKFTIGDGSGSHSERWLMNVAGGPTTLHAQSPDYGQIGTTNSNQFRKGNTYTITVDHQGTHPQYVASTQDSSGKTLYRGSSWKGADSPDYDYTAKVETSSSVGYLIVDESQPKLLGTSNGSETNEASGKTAYIAFPKPILSFTDYTEEEVEGDPGVLVLVNDNDSNEDGDIDLDSPYMQDPDYVEINLELELAGAVTINEGTVRLSANTSDLRVWDSVGGFTSLGLPIEWDMSTTEGDQFRGTGKTIYLEALDSSQTHKDVTLKFEYVNHGTTTAEADITLLKMDVEEVSFSGTKYFELKSDDVSETYSKPHWVDANGDGDALDTGDKNYPVAYTRNTKPKIEAKFELGTDLSSQTIKIKATGPGGIAIPETTATVSGSTATLPETESTGAFVDTIKHYDRETAGNEFELNWEMQIGSSGWFSVGGTKHTLYLTLADPVTTLRQETLFEISCRNADGIDQTSEVTEAIWNEFTDRVVKRVDGQQLTYYTNYNCGNVTTESLLANGDGQCGSWAKFFIDLRKIHGIDDSNEYIIFEPITDDGFAVKNWSFSGSGTSGHGTHPYLNIPDSSLIGASSYNWKYSEVNDASGIPGQGNSNPASLFNNHQVVISGEYYDPSYGQKHASLQDIDDNAIDGYYIGGTYPVNEPSVGLDLNGDGDQDDLAVMIYVMLFRKNPAGLDLKETPYEY